MITKVIFRRWKSGSKNIIALFPEIPTKAINYFPCSSFEHIGQHGAASPDLVIAHTTPAKGWERDVQDLKRELENPPYSYKLKICQRLTKKMMDMRKQTLLNELNTLKKEIQ